jgi:hypothetical protein
LVEKNKATGLSLLSTVWPFQAESASDTVLALTPATVFDTDKVKKKLMDARNINTAGNASASVAWIEWLRLMGYAGLVALALSCSMGAAVVLLG